MLKFIFLCFLVGYSLACVTVRVEFISDTKVNVVANNNTISICDSVLDVANTMACGNDANNITIHNYGWKLFSGHYATGWNAFSIAQTSTGNVIKLGQHHCNKLG